MINAQILRFSQITVYSGAIIIITGRDVTQFQSLTSDSAAAAAEKALCPSFVAWRRACRATRVESTAAII
jgi:NADH:ubiquinone oxidoreductase subunit 6 (subunit J)